MKTEGTHRTFKDSILGILSYSSYIFMLVYGMMALTLHPAFLLPAVMYGRLAFKGTLDLVQGVGRLYWIVRKDQRWFSIGKGTMHELSDPWRKGSGVYIAIAKYCLQIGLCRRQTFNETDGVLSAVQGRFLETEPREIGNWGVQEKSGTAKLTA